MHSHYGSAFSENEQDELFMTPMSLFYPSVIRSSIIDITTKDLECLGVKGLLLDVDNTLTHPKSQHLDPAVRQWLDSMNSAGIGLTIVSNALPGRVKPFAEKLGLRCIAFSCKPSPVGFWRGARRLGLKRAQCAAVGDQTFTDIIGSRLAGVKSIQVMPMISERQWSIRFKRHLERFVIKHYNKRLERTQKK